MRFRFADCDGISNNVDTIRRDTGVSANPKRVFLSYAWEDDDYRLWVKRLATRLRGRGKRKARHVASVEDRQHP